MDWEDQDVLHGYKELETGTRDPESERVEMELLEPAVPTNMASARPPWWGWVVMVSGIIIAAILFMLLVFSIMNWSTLHGMVPSGSHSKMYDYNLDIPAPAGEDCPTVVPQYSDLQNKTYFSIRSALNDMSLDIPGGNMSPGTAVTMYLHHGLSHQVWSHNTYTGAIHSKRNPDFVLDIEDDLLVINVYNKDKDTQRYGLGPRSIYLLSNNNKVLGIVDGSRAHSARIALETFTGATSQRWQYDEV